jgi:group I intron endonuclease
VDIDVKYLFYGHEESGGIYSITNIVNNKIYIGSTSRFIKRFQEHTCDLNANIHINKHLQSSFNHHQEYNFVFEVLEVIVGDMWARTTIEQEYIDMYLDTWKQCYNNKKKVIRRDSVYGDIELARLNNSISKKELCKTEAGYNRIKSMSDNMRGKTYEELYGLEKAIELKENRRITASITANRSEHKQKLSDLFLGVSYEDRFGSDRAKEIKAKNSANRKGKCVGNKNPKYKIWENIKLMSPEGKLYTRIEGVTSFAEEHGLKQPQLTRLLLRKRKSCHGWILID